ncbi:MAG: chemotaxis protein CheW [Burkholderiales bacterium]
MAHLLILRLDGVRLGLPATQVERLLRASWVERLPGAPAAVLGAIDAAGRILPVIDLRHVLGLPTRMTRPSDCFVVAHTGRRTVALLADSGEGIRELDENDVTPVRGVAPGVAQVSGLLRLADGLVLIHDLGALLSLDDERALDAALETA